MCQDIFVHYGEGTVPLAPVIFNTLERAWGPATHGRYVSIKIDLQLGTC